MTAVPAAEEPEELPRGACEAQEGVVVYGLHLPQPKVMANIADERPYLLLKAFSSKDTKCCDVRSISGK